MDCGDTIIKVLDEAGDKGLPISKIVRHVYNSSNNLFDKIDMKDVRSAVIKFLHEHSRNTFFGEPLFTKIGSRGFYRINRKSPFYTKRQMPPENTRQETVL